MDTAAEVSEVGWAGKEVGTSGTLWADLKMNQMVRHLRFPESVDQEPDLEGFVALRVRHHVDSRLEWAVNLALLDVSGSSPTGVEL